MPLLHRICVLGKNCGAFERMVRGLSNHMYCFGKPDPWAVLVLEIQISSMERIEDQEGLRVHPVNILQNWILIQFNTKNPMISSPQIRLTSIIRSSQNQIDEN